MSGPIINSLVQSGTGDAIASAMRLGYADGFVIKNNSATDVAITDGAIEANNKLYKLSWPSAHYSSNQVQVGVLNNYLLPGGHGLAFEAGQFIIVAGFANGANNGVKEIISFIGDVITVVETLVAELPGPSVTVDSIDYITYSLTSLAAGFDIHYVYIDDSGSSPPTPTFIDSTTAPVWSHVKRGWYNGDDRCIGFCYSPAGGATIIPFGTDVQSGNKIRMFFSLAASAELNIAFNMSPNGAWQTPNVREISTILPPQAKETYIWMTNSDTGALVTLAAVQAELATGIFTSGHLYGDLAEQASEQRWIPLGSSQNVRLSGAADDDNALTAYLNGVGYWR